MYHVTNNKELPNCDAPRLHATFVSWWILMPCPDHSMQPISAKFHLHNHLASLLSGSCIRPGQWEDHNINAMTPWHHDMFCENPLSCIKCATLVPDLISALQRGWWRGRPFRPSCCFPGLARHESARTVAHWQFPNRWNTRIKWGKVQPKWNTMIC